VALAPAFFDVLERGVELDYDDEVEASLPGGIQSFAVIGVDYIDLS
jgi:hypothetical protein